MEYGEPLDPAIKVEMTEVFTQDEISRILISETIKRCNKPYGWYAGHTRLLVIDGGYTCTVYVWTRQSEDEN